MMACESNTAGNVLHKDENIYSADAAQSYYTCYLLRLHHMHFIIQSNIMASSHKMPIST